MTRPENTDWEQYYRRPHLAALLTRAVTGRRLLKAMGSHLPARGPGQLVVLELGGGGGSFYELIRRRLQPLRYHLADRSLAGLTNLESAPRADPAVVCHVCDVRGCQLPLKADVVFSVGLIEHFGPEDTRRVIDAHFAHVAPAGLVIITFPTPTWLYRLARRLAEALRLWRFPDERPLDLAEVLAALEGRGLLVEQDIIWPIVYTQGLVVIKAGAAQTAPPSQR